MKVIDSRGKILRTYNDLKPEKVLLNKEDLSTGFIS